ncbi:MAG: hypothetical protein K2X87_20870 [Gemmataceae bacterium]|nr:hypothetical protein [Gemmataceae bacterium]
MGIDLPSYAFPDLTATNHYVTSPATSEYNCIAWAAGFSDEPWWPSGDPAVAYWPPSAPQEVTLPAFVAAFATLGYSPCPDGVVEPGYGKVALYTLGGVPTHAARQLPDGRWSSKLGNWYDIAHALDGPVYGSPALFLRRPAEGGVA